MCICAIVGWPLARIRSERWTQRMMQGQWWRRVAHTTTDVRGTTAARDDRERSVLSHSQREPPAPEGWESGLSMLSHIVAELARFRAEERRWEAVHLADPDTASSPPRDGP
jgi:hypothetical protein